MAEMNDIAALVGFKATKDFLACRRAMRPVVGDLFITNREGHLIFSQVDWIDAGEIGVGRFYVQGGTPISFARFSLSDWPEAVMKTLRIGAEFRAARMPVPCPECEGIGEGAWNETSPCVGATKNDHE